MTDSTRRQLRDALTGVVAVLVTPYRVHDGRINESVIEELASRVEAAGIPAMTALGNTAEIFQLSHHERRTYLRAIARTRQTAVLIAGVKGSASGVLDDIDYAACLGYEAAMLHEPSDPFGDSDGLFAYYTKIADRSGLPLVLYLRSQRVDGSVISQLVQHRSVAAVKYARSDLDTLRRILDGDAREACTWLNGAAESRALDYLPLRLTGFTSGIANIRPDLALAVHAALLARDDHRLRRLRDLIGPVEALRTVGGGKFNVAVLKHLLRGIGIEAGGVRPPHSELTSEAGQRLRQAVAAWPPPTVAGVPRSLRSDVLGPPR